jgi:hypothetical protein
MPNWYIPESEEDLNQHNDDERAQYENDNIEPDPDYKDNLR